MPHKHTHKHTLVVRWKKSFMSMEEISISLVGPGTKNCSEQSRKCTEGASFAITCSQSFTWRILEKYLDSENEMDTTSGAPLDASHLTEALSAFANCRLLRSGSSDGGGARGVSGYCTPPHTYTHVNLSRREVGGGGARDRDARCVALGASDRKTRRVVGSGGRYERAVE